MIPEVSNDAALFGYRLYVDLPQKPQPVTLADLKEELAAITGVSYDHMQVVSSGVLMKDDKAPLAKYRLEDGSRITMVSKGSGVEPDRIPRKQSQQHANPPRSKSTPRDAGADGAGSRPTAEFEAQQAAAAARKAAEADQSEQGIMRRIQAAQHVAQVELLPEVLQLEQSVDSVAKEGLEKTSTLQELAPEAISLTGPNASAAGRLNLHQTVFQHKKLSELLLRQLLALDNVQAPTDELRLARKEAVKVVQSTLDRVDAAWTKAKSLGVKPNM